MVQTMNKYSCTRLILFVIMIGLIEEIMYRGWLVNNYFSILLLFTEPAHIVVLLYVYFSKNCSLFCCLIIIMLYLYTFINVIKSIFYRSETEEIIKHQLLWGTTISFAISHIYEYRTINVLAIVKSILSRLPLFIGLFYSAANNNFLLCCLLHTCYNALMILLMRLINSNELGRILLAKIYDPTQCSEFHIKFISGLNALVSHPIN